jgi:hypothetical protein
MNVLTTNEMEIMLDALNTIRRKDDMPAMCLRDLQHFLGALHTVGFALVKRGTLLQFEEWWRTADETIRRYREAGLL